MDNNSIKEKMTAQQVSERYGYSVNSIKTKFKRTQQAIKKKFGVEIIKCQGLDGIYYMISDERALTMFDEIKNELYIPLDSLKIENFVFYVLVGIAATPQGMFRGTKKDFLKYIGVAVNQKNEELLQKALILWADSEIISFDIDQDVIIVYIRRAFEKTTIMSIQMLRECQRIIKENHKQDIKIPQLLKVWQAHRLCMKSQPFTIDDIQKYIDLSKDQIKQGRKLLKENNILKLTAAIESDGENVFRTGTYSDHTAWYDTIGIKLQDEK